MGAVRPRTHSHASSLMFAGNTPSLEMWLAAAHALINPLLFSGKWGLERYKHTLTVRVGGGTKHSLKSIFVTFLTLKIPCRRRARSCSSAGTRRYLSRHIQNITGSKSQLFCTQDRSIHTRVVVCTLTPPQVMWKIQKIYSEGGLRSQRISEWLMSAGWESDVPDLETLERDAAARRGGSLKWTLMFQMENTKSRWI